MATHADVPKTSHWVRSVLQNSTALAESNPRVAVTSQLKKSVNLMWKCSQLSQHWRGAKLRVASAIVTRLRSPPLTPRTKSLPTRVLTVCEIPNMAMTTCSRVSQVSDHSQRTYSHRASEPHIALESRRLELSEVHGRVLRNRVCHQR